MFSSNNQKSQPAKSSKKPQPARDANAVTILTSGCHFSGKLYCRGASRISGRIEGQLISEGLLVIEEEAIITAEVKADEVVIQGKVQGKGAGCTRCRVARIDSRQHRHRRSPGTLEKGDRQR